MKIFWAALAISLIYHLLQFVGIYWASERYLNTKRHTEVIDIELSEPANPSESRAEKPIVKTSDLPQPKTTVTNDSARLFSDKTQRFEKQTQAIKKGQFQQRQAQPKKPQVQQKKFEFEDAVQSSQALNPKTVISSNQWTFRSGQSQMEYNLPQDIPFGEITVLDTDTHIYASFYNRVVDLFYIRWVQRLDALWARLSRQAKLELSGKVWLTEVEIILNSEGIYQTGVLRKPSGFPPFDQAVIFAFQSAQVFPNPPRGKIDSDGKVRLKYRVAVQVY